MNNTNIEKPDTQHPPTIIYEKYPEDSYEGSFLDEKIEHVPEGTASSGKALFMLLKAFIGTGVIFLPGSFVSGGLVLSIILMLVLALICVAAFQILVKAQQQIGGSYGDVAQHLYGAWLRHLIHFFLCISQMGFVASYLIFISENIGIVVDSLNNCNAPFEAKYYIWIVLIAIIPITWVRKIARLSYFAIVADIFIAFGLICILYFCSNQIAHHGIGNNIILVNQNSFGLMIGTAVFSYEGIGMVLPIVQGMKDPKKFPMVLNIGMLICTLIFTLIGAIGYIAFGDITQASVVANIPRIPLSITVQILYAIAMILTSPFMLYPPLVIIERYIFGNHSGRKSVRVKMGKNFIRSLIPIICAVISFCVGSSNLNKFVSLVGSVACMPLCFIFPGLFHFRVTTKSYAKILDIILVLFGWAMMVYTMYININSWIHPSSTGVIINMTNCQS
ncbi:transmembrane amino acid transporter protein-domain-containing protein [Cokeromyces recurvatus]|uniref:transmembrane amino acid transporter protein-domain-containing protein n=1 Tax=Cokeromyces recurvatus TaxID=90255 RepID=UPI0022206A7F|nr:transmembrane amino acid transporter protein-domain-containing protein [Cokeromyces recurvatus]KAI7903914.1 transmembrane amino acid transporter protein-domain-containing protein [Cokeromyces recurvatus]